MENKVSCEICNKNFVSSNRLSNHKSRFHSAVRDSTNVKNTEDKLYSCRKCDKTHKTRQSLITHEQNCILSNHEHNYTEINSDSDSDESFVTDNRETIPIYEHLSKILKLKKYIIRIQHELLISNSLVNRLVNVLEKS